MQKLSKWGVTLGAAVFGLGIAIPAVVSLSHHGTKTANTVDDEILLGAAELSPRDAAVGTIKGDDNQPLNDNNKWYEVNGYYTTVGDVKEYIAPNYSNVTGKIDKIDRAVVYRTDVTTATDVGPRKSATTVGAYSVVEGYNSTASANYTHAEGNQSTASKQSAHAEGNLTTASGTGAHAEGGTTQASGDYSHAEGDSTKATTYYAHAEGHTTTASGNSSHAEGYNTAASGYYSHVEGENTKAQNTAEHAEGRFNASHKASANWGDAGNTISTIGIGRSDSTRTNAVEVMQDGKVYVYKLGGYTGTNPTASGVKDLASAVSDKADQSEVSELATAVASKASMADIDAASEELRLYADGKQFIMAKDADYYRTGKSGEMGTGWAHTAITGDGIRRFGAYAPRIIGDITLTASSESDPFVTHYGQEFDFVGMKYEVTGIRDYTETGFEGYNGITVRYQPIAGVPLYVVVSKNVLAGTATIDSVEFSAFSDSTDYYYNISISGNTVTYTSENEGAAFTFTVNVNDTAGQNVAAWVFGDGGQYLLNSDIERVSTFAERTGAEGEKGSGWGYKVYDFAKDTRGWEAYVPKLTTSIATNNTQVSIGSWSGSSYSDYYRYYHFWPFPLVYSNSTYTATAAFTESIGTYGSNQCATAVWNVSLFGDIFNIVITNAVSSSSGGFLGIYADKVRTNAVVRIQDPGYKSSGYYVYRYLPVYGIMDCSNFKIDSFSRSGSTYTVNYSYDVSASDGIQNIKFQSAPTSAWAYLAVVDQNNFVTFTNAVYHVTDVATIKTYPATFVKECWSTERMINSKTHHYYYDEALDCTWNIAVTNGCFYTEIISNDDWRED